MLLWGRDFFERWAVVRSRGLANYFFHNVGGAIVIFLGVAIIDYFLTSTFYVIFWVIMFSVAIFIPLFFWFISEWRYRRYIGRKK